MQMLVHPTDNTFIDADNIKVKAISDKLNGLLGGHVTYLKHIGSGVGGDVYLCQYSGPDENIKKLCDSNGRACVKIALRKHELNHEAVIAYELFQKQALSSEKPPYIVGIPIKEKDETIALLMNYVSYHDSQTDSLEDSLKSFLKKFFHSIVSGSVKHKEITSKLHQGLYDDIGIILVQLINEMQSILLQFQTLGYLHLDVASRNFVLNQPVLDNDGNLIQLSLVLCDYGLAGQLNKQEKVNTYHQHNKKPITARNYQDIAQNIASVNTDIFALRCAIIGMISLVVSDVMHDYSILSIGQKSIEEFESMRINHEFYQRDTTVLNQFLQILLQHVDYCSDQHIKKQVKHVIHFFKEYLLTLPDANLSMEQAHQSDQSLLLSTNEKYFTNVFDAKIKHVNDINNDEEINSLLLFIRRLLEIPVTEEFKNSPKYQEIKVIANADMLKKYLLHKKAVKNQIEPIGKENIAPSLSEGSPQLEWIDKLSHYLQQWKEERKDDMQEIKWFGKEMEIQTNTIINDIIKGKITSLIDAQDEYLKLVKDIAAKINEKKQSREVSFNKDKLQVGPQKFALNVSGYESEQGSKQGVAAHNKVYKPIEK